MKMQKRGNILTENIIFIILNLVFLFILVLFVFTKMNNAATVEEKYAKEIALVIDKARPGMTIVLEMSDAFKIAEKESADMSKVVTIKDNIVTVRLREKGGYSYSFFSDTKFDAQKSSYYYSPSDKGLVLFIG